MDPEVQAQFDELQRQINEIRQSPALPVGLDAQTISVLNQKLDLTPGLTFGDIFYVDTNGEIKRLPPGVSGQYLKTLGSSAAPAWSSISVPPAFTVATTSISVTSGTTNDTTATWSTGLTTCDALLGFMFFGSTAYYIGFWNNSIGANDTSFVSDGRGTSSVSFLGTDTSVYLNNLSFSAGTLTYHYKNNGVTSGTAKLIALGTV
jgi:hypothetical protein